MQQNVGNDCNLRSSLFYNTNAGQNRYECETSAKRVTWVQHEFQMNDTSATRAKKFDFYNDASENIFSNPYISYIANKRLPGEAQFPSNNYLLKMPCSHAKMCLKSSPQKLNVTMAKAIWKSYELDCSCKCPCMFRIITYSSTALFSMKTILCETKNILFN